MTASSPATSQAPPEIARSCSRNLSDLAPSPVQIHALQSSGGGGMSGSSSFGYATGRGSRDSALRRRAADESASSVDSTPTRRFRELDLSEVRPPVLEVSPPKVPVIRVTHARHQQSFTPSEVDEMLREDSFSDMELELPNREIRIRGGPRASTPVSTAKPPVTAPHQDEDVAAAAAADAAARLAQEDAGLQRSGGRLSRAAPLMIEYHRE